MKWTMSRKPPRKPSVPLAAISWPAGGGVRMIREELPPAKDDLEAAIVKKFVGALREHDGRCLELIPREDSNDWPDFEGKLEGRKIGIEVVEAILPDHARKRSKQDEYLAELLPRLAGLEAELEGLCLTINDNYQSPEWPPAASKQGQLLLKHLRERLTTDVPVLQRISRADSRTWANDLGVHTGIMAMRGRRIDGSPPEPIDLRFSGTFPTDSTLLARCVAGKLGKQYTTYSGGDLWLLAYNEHGFTAESESITIAREILATNEYPFAAAWSFFPFPSQDGGVLVPLLP
jgi:hypothetical protein